MQEATSFDNVTIVYVKGNSYRIHFWYMSKGDTVSIMNNSILVDKKYVFKFFLLWYKKVSEKTYYQRNRDVILIEQKIIVKMIKKN